MEKRSPSFLKIMQKRYFVLRNRMLFYYKSESHFKNHMPIKGVLNFQQVCFEATFTQKKLKIVLKMQGSNRLFILRCQNEEDFLVWQKKLTHSIDYSYGKVKKLTIDDYSDIINNMFEFWRFLRVTEKMLKQTADVGDIILCLG